MFFNALRTTIWLLFAGGALVGVLRLTCLRWWQVPEDDPDLAVSLAPSLQAGDWVILWRLTPPGFGDLVLCPDPQDPAEVVVGRIVGEGGDELTVDSDGDLEVNNVRIRSGHACSPPTVLVQHPRTGDEVELRCDIERLGGVHHRRAMLRRGGLKPLEVKAEVDPGMLFLVSDNRQYPFDSRDFGTVPRESCSERIVFRLVSRLGFGDVESRLSWIP